MEKNEFAKGNDPLRSRVIIVGAGIAGPAMAIQLRRIGIDPIVFEARREDELEGGVFLGITPNGLHVLKQMIDIDVLLGAYTPGKMVFYNAKNTAIGELDTRHQAERYGAETVQVKRSAISLALREEAVKNGLGLRLSR